jgi:hypothetical protein
MIPNCANRQIVDRTDGSVVLHPFPTDSELMVKWSEAVNRNRLEPLTITEHSLVCQLHFGPDDYVNGDELRSSVVPSVFEVDRLSDKRKFSSPVDSPNANSSHIDDSIRSDMDEEYTDEDGNETYTSYDEDNDQVNGEQSSISVDDRQQSQQLNDSHLNSSRSSSSGKKRGLSDVINKLHQQQSSHQQQQQVDEPAAQPPNTRTNMYHISNLLMNHEQQQQQPPQKKLKLSNEQQHDAKIQQFTTKTPANKSEIDLFHLLEKANLTSYMSIFTDKGSILF